MLACVRPLSLRDLGKIRSIEIAVWKKLARISRQQPRADAFFPGCRLGPFKKRLVPVNPNWCGVHNMALLEHAPWEQYQGLTWALSIVACRLWTTFETIMNAHIPRITINKRARNFYITVLTLFAHLFVFCLIRCKAFNQLSHPLAPRETSDVKGCRLWMGPTPLRAYNVLVSM